MMRKNNPYKAATCFIKEDFRLLALFLWMMLRLASLSSMATTSGKNAAASALSLFSRRRRTALRVVLWSWRRHVQRALPVQGLGHRLLLWHAPLANHTWRHALHVWLVPPVI